MKGAAFAQAPLMRSHSLQRLQIEASTYRDLSTVATFRPRRFSRPRRFTPLRPLPKSPSDTTLGVLPSRALPESLRTAPSPTLSPLLTFLAVAPAFYGGELPRLASAPGLQGLTPATRPSPPASGFPYTGDRHPLGFFFFGTSLPWFLAGRTPSVSRAVRPRHLSRIEKEQQRAEEETTDPQIDLQYPLLPTLQTTRFHLYFHALRRLLCFIF